MKSVWSHSLHMSLCAAAICALLGAAHAQSTPSATSSGAVTSTEPAAPAPAAPQVQSQSDKQPAQAQRKSSVRKVDRTSDRHQGQRGKYATPQAHEAAAARAEERAGRLSRGATADDYQRNALARCDVFREPADRDSCIARVRSAEISGSVQEGGVLRELTEQVPVQP